MPDSERLDGVGFACAPERNSPDISNQQLK
jgi:hypothetical protein